MIVSFKFYVMNFVDFVLNCYSHITSYVSQVFASFTHYTSYSLLNIVHVIVCVFGLTNQVYKYFEFLCKTILMLENLNFEKTGFKSCVLEKHFVSYSCILWIWSMGFVATMLYSWSILVNLINLGICEKLKILGLVLNPNWGFCSNWFQLMKLACWIDVIDHYFK